MKMIPTFLRALTIAMPLVTASGCSTMGSATLAEQKNFRCSPENQAQPLELENADSPLKYSMGIIEPDFYAADAKIKYPSRLWLIMSERAPNPDESPFDVQPQINIAFEKIPEAGKSFTIKDDCTTPEGPSEASLCGTELVYEQVSITIDKSPAPSGGELDIRFTLKDLNGKTISGRAKSCIRVDQKT
jgi:hypothetical protein